MDTFLSAFTNALASWIVRAFLIATAISGLLAMVLDFWVWHKPDSERKVMWVRALPFIIFGVLMLFGMSVAISFNIWQEGHQSLNAETQDNQKQVGDLQGKINELQKQISSITSLNFTQLPSEDQKVNSPDTASVTVTNTPDFNPAYSSTIPWKIDNPDPNNHVFEVVRIKILPVGFKFTDIDQTNLPSNVSVLDEYLGTNNVTIIFNDFAPGDSKVIELPVYTMVTDLNIRGTEKLTLEIIDKRLLLP